MPSSTSVGPPGQRPRSRVAVLSVALLLVLAAVAPLIAATAARTDTGGTAARSTDSVPHGNATDGNLTLYVGPGTSFDALGEFGDVTTAHGTGAIERERAEIPVGDTLVVAFTSRRLGAEYADTVGPNASVRFFGALEGTDASLAITSPSGTECDPVRIRLNESRHRVLVNATSGEFRLLLDTDALAATGGCDGELDVPGAYEVALGLPTRNGTRRATETFYLVDPEPTPDPAGGIHVRRAAPALAGDLRSVADIRRAARAERLVRTGYVVHGEVAVLDVRSPQLMRAYANATGENATIRLLRAVNATGGRFGFDPQVAITKSGTGQPREPPGLVFPGPGIRTVPDPANDTFYLILDTGRVRLRTAEGTVALSNSTVDELRPTLVVAGPNRTLYEGRLRVVEPAGSLEIARNRSADGGRSLAVVGTDAQFVVRPGTNLAPGSRVVVSVRAGNETLAERTVEVDDGDLAPRVGAEAEAGGLTFDLGPQPTGRALNVTLARNGAELHRAIVLVGPRPTLRDATARRVRHGPEGTTIRFAVTARYPAPGYVVVRNASGRYVSFEVPTGEWVRVNGTVTVRSEHRERQFGIRLIAVYDGNQNGRFDGPRGRGYNDPAFSTTDGEALVRTAVLPPPSPTPTVTAPPPGTTLAVDDGQPGFGVLAALLGFLGLVGLFGVRRGGRLSP